MVGITVITLLTDLGESEYPAMMKGVILNIAPDVQIVDNTHSILPQNILEGAFILENSVKFFPPGTIHVGIVDPGVGSSRKPLAIECKKGILIGPDNGLLVPAANLLGLKRVFDLSNKKFFLPEVSETFHGRDIFAPVAAHLANDPSLVTEVGSRWNEPLVQLDIPKPRASIESIDGTIMHIDSFGNLISNVTSSMVNTIYSELHGDTELELHINDKFAQLRFCNNYAEGEFNQFITLLSSSGHLELAVVQGSAEKQLNAKVGDRFKIML